MRLMWFALAAVRFATELCLLGAAAVAGTRLVEGAAGWALAIVLAVAVGAVWGVAIAPKAGRRLADPARLVVEVVLFASIGILLAATGLPGWGIALAIGGTAVAIAVRRAPLAI